MYWYMYLLYYGRMIFRQFVVSFKKLKNYILFYQQPEPAPGVKFLEPEPPQSRPAPKPWLRLCRYGVLLAYGSLSVSGTQLSYRLQVNNSLGEYGKN